MTVAGPAVANAVAVSVKVLVPSPGDAIRVGENAAVTPLGNPDTDNATAALKFRAAMVSVKLVRLPASRVALVVLEVSAIAGAGAVTVKLMATVFATPLLVALIVMVEVPAAALFVAEIVAVTAPVAVSVGEENITVTPVGAPL